ncbi:Ser/Thr protein phosphatase family protein [Peptoniphilus sp. ING2-D1G]|nr:Ser/Thr protein phosphatase family protein [Peptoniphilus sp. ING2-D1G]
MIWAIGDLHFDPVGDKPMDIFGINWIMHKEKIISHWKEVVAEEDLVLLVGDISWGLKLKDSIVDLEEIDFLPGKKIISKGNHDYWWSSMNKMDEIGLKTIKFLNNNSYIYDDIAIFGTRGWISKDTPGFTEKDGRIFERELNRLKNSHDSITSCSKKIAMIHYPPFDQSGDLNEFSNFFSEVSTDLCIYGHLHGDGHKFVIEGEFKNVNYRCVASDYVDFKLQEVTV